MGLQQGQSKMKKFWERLLKKTDKKVEEPLWFRYLTQSFNGEFVAVTMMCGCQQTSVLFSENSEDFYCLHCDRPCTAGANCQSCRKHFMFDAESIPEDYFEEDED